MASVQDVFIAHLDAYSAGRVLHPREQRAARAITGCYRGEFGSHWVGCPQGHGLAEQFHACRHRSCPRCAAAPRQQWVQAQLQRLLPCAHFHVVFTLPHELLALWSFNREAMITLLMGCVRDSLLQMMADPRHLGATPGITLSLHTWGRTLSHHPHVHALVSAGGLRADGTWQPTREGFLLPLAPLRKLFAGKLLGQLDQQLQANTLRLPPQQPAEHWRGAITRLYRQHWNIQINPPYASGRGVALYLARYAKGGPLPHDRALRLHAGEVSFDYTDHRQRQRKRLRLPASEFIARVLWHAPPKGVHTTRHAGLYASAARPHHGQALLALACATPQPPHPLHPPQLAQPSQPLWPQAAAQPNAAPSPRQMGVCTVCGTPLRRLAPPTGCTAHQISLQNRANGQSHLPATERLGPTWRSTRSSKAEAARPQPPPASLQPRPGSLSL